MKQIIGVFASISFFFLMLCFPGETVSGAGEGLLLWFHTVLPTLLPFFIFTNLLIRTNAILYVSRFIGPILQKVFCVSPDGSFAVLAGFLCGYPVGAKVAADLVREKRISAAEGAYLLSFCNNTSPAFITGYVLIRNLKADSMILPTLLILYASPVVCSFLFRAWYKADRTLSALVPAKKEAPRFSFAVFDGCILDAFEAITKIGGYIILFSILFVFCRRLPSTPLLAFLEITNGVPYLIRHASGFAASYISVLALTSFGGLCAAAQTNAMLGESGLSIAPYILEKLITAAVTSFLAFLYIQFIR